jgi:hypothetical protein
MKVAVCVVAAALLLSVLAAYAGHELTFYPSFYPQEISVRFVPAPATAAALLRKNALHAYVGDDPFAGGAAPDTRWMESLRGWVVLTFERATGAFAEADARCAAAARLSSALGERPGFVAHGYAVTPYHEDYVLHHDLAQKTRERPAGSLPRVRGRGALGKALAAAGMTAAGADADAILEEIELAPLLARAETRMNGWTGPPWVKEGWYHAWLLQSSPAARAAAADTFRRRTEGVWQTTAERVGLERRLVTQLAARCERVVLGYTLRREPLNDAYSEGVENVAADAQRGLASPIFVRTVKLKDFPWNGWLQVGVSARPAAAWNPIAGFSDLTGQLVWAAVGDPALLIDPDNARFVANRARPMSVTEVAEAPAGALVPATLRGAGAPTAARTKVVYRVLLSKSHDDRPMTVADVLYPYAFVARWGTEGAGRDHDPEVERSSALARRLVAAVRVAKVAREVKDLGDLQLAYDVPEVEVYLKTAIDARTAVTIAPPWSPVPWHVVALMEQAVARGIGAFSESEARRRGVPWLDLVRDPRQLAALSRLAAELEQKAWVPEPLRGLVSAEEARQRWGGLRAFARSRGHFLPTAGPYMLGKLTADSVTLPVFRDFSYALGVGSFDQYPIRLRAFVRAVQRNGERLEVQADVERVEKAGRSYKIVREPFRPQQPGEKSREPLTAHWLVVGAADEAIAAGTSRALHEGRLVVEPAPRPRPGVYRLVLALSVDGNLVQPEVKVLSYRVGD